MTATLFDTLNTPERREEAKRQQEQLRERHGHRVAGQPAIRQHLYGLGRVEQALAGLAALEDPKEAARYGEAALRARKHDLYRQIAEGFAAQGRYEEAIAAAESGLDGASVEIYSTRAAAVAAIDAAACPCPETVTLPSATDAMGTTTQTRTKIEEIYDGARTVAFYRCTRCGAISAKTAN